MNRKRFPLHVAQNSPIPRLAAARQDIKVTVPFCPWLPYRGLKVSPTRTVVTPWKI